MSMTSAAAMDLTFRDSPPAGIVPGLNYPRCRRARCRAPQGLSRTQMRSWRRQRASARELGRIHELRLGFDILANVLPKNENEKFSKVQVLRYAIDYIQQLAEMNAAAGPDVPTPSSSSTTTSPAPADPMTWRPQSHSQQQSQHLSSYQHQFSDCEDLVGSPSFPAMGSPASIDSSVISSTGSSCSGGGSVGNSPLPCNILQDLDQFVLDEAGSADMSQFLAATMPAFLPGAHDLTTGLDMTEMVPYGSVSDGAHLPALPQYSDQALLSNNHHSSLPPLSGVEKAILEATLKRPQRPSASSCMAQQSFAANPSSMSAYSGYLEQNSASFDYCTFAGLDSGRHLGFETSTNFNQYLPCAAY